MKGQICGIKVLHVLGEIMYKYEYRAQTQQINEQKSTLAAIIDKIIGTKDYALDNFKKCYNPKDIFTYEGVEVDYSKFPDGDINIMRRVEAAFDSPHEIVANGFYPIKTSKEDWDSFKEEYDRIRKKQETEEKAREQE